MRLSKSKVMSALQCTKRLHFEVHDRDLAEVSASTQAAFEAGRLVGETTREIYGTRAGTLIEYTPGLEEALGETAELMARGPSGPIFEATLEHAGVLVRLDVLLPAGSAWRIVEVKSTTSLKEEHLADCAIQAWVFEGAGYTFERLALAHVDNTFVYQGDGDFGGLLVEQDVTEEVRELMAEVPGWVELARQAAASTRPAVAVGEHCSKPYPCPFFKQCWPSAAEYPVYGLGGSKAALAELVKQGYGDIRDVPAGRLKSDQHRRIHRVTSGGEAELLDGAAVFARNLAYPRYYLDFETVAPAVPIWAGTRPYERLPVQWSCHIEAGPGQMRHEEFLELEGEPPMRALAESLIEKLGTEGPVLIYTGYEKGVINDLATRFPDLAPRLSALVERVVDLHPIAKTNYYHPDMLGSWSIKAVLPTVAAEMRYSVLEEIREGTTASQAYFEAIQPDTTQERREELRERLFEYCKYDTEAMVRLVRFFGADTAK
ncbi:MAG: DUF2779 domain-containing protein [Thermoanaerobaculia bacterium]